MYGVHVIYENIEDIQINVLIKILRRVEQISTYLVSIIVGTIVRRIL